MGEGGPYTSSSLCIFCFLWGYWQVTESGLDKASHVMLLLQRSGRMSEES